MAKLILVEGPDNSGKSTFIKMLQERFASKVKLLSFPKKNVDGNRFTIVTRNEVAIFEEMLQHLDPSYTYILDRGYISNIVYEQLRGIDPARYMGDLERLFVYNDVVVVPMTRNHIGIDFKDDLITLDKDQFNSVINLFNYYYHHYDLDPWRQLKHDDHNKVMFSSGWDNFYLIDELVDR